MHEMRDWPSSLRFNAAVCAEAKSAYIHYCEAHSKPIFGWSALDSVTRQRWMERAEMLFKVVKAAEDAETQKRRDQERLDALVGELYPPAALPVLQEAAKQEAAKILQMHPIDARD